MQWSVLIVAVSTSAVAAGDPEEISAGVSGVTAEALQEQVGTRQRKLHVSGWKREGESTICSPSMAWPQHFDNNV